MPIYRVHRVLALDAQARAQCSGAFAILARLDSSETDLHHVGPLAPPFAITGFGTFAFMVAEALPLPDINGTPSPACSPGCITTDEEEDRVYGYKTPFTKGPKLRILINRQGRLWCPICPGRMDQGWTWDGAKNHVLELVSPSSYADLKKRSRNRALARNEGWLLPLSAAAADVEDNEDDDASI